MDPWDTAARNLHINRESRKKYGLKGSLFTLKGCAVFPSFAETRELCYKINKKRGPNKPPISAAELHGAALLHEAWHILISRYEKTSGEIFKDLIPVLSEKIGSSELRKTLTGFVSFFPPPEVFLKQASPAQYLKTGEAIILEEVLLLSLTDRNKALGPIREFFVFEKLAKSTAYPSLIRNMEQYFQTVPPFGPDKEDLISFLLAPLKAHPDSIFDQLRYISVYWKDYLGDFFSKILGGLDFIQEESRFRGPGPGPAEGWIHGGLDLETVSYSEDTDWMPKVVLLAKSTYVWLWQLSKTYGRDISRLDQIPDEELDIIHSRGFTGLWLIGLWERSEASRKIKQTCGNPEAVSSAYSVFDYEIASCLGGWDALHNLKDRCLLRGIRLASDMVPNHTGLDSRWVQEHPDWYIQTPKSPFPSYSFNGQNLSSRPGLGLFLEDHYYNKTDAAVVFNRTDYSSGETRYIYHGNDGTHMPWNDTAQLNFLLREVREAVINMIIHVARSFPIIRFDAAMTLTRRHFQRLWFPERGTGGDIPSRAEHALSTEEFLSRMPEEFWRQVVDRVGEEVPDTLLLAEAFWLMESYFVRTLGMHRVYNSAFMHMLKQEDNHKYRESIKKTILFDPEILKRFVNFMNNPDEDTAVAQFGKGDKYFGICTLLATLPGLPMFGHGQVEGLQEKYGMEYARPYWNEFPDTGFIERHERDIFPLLKIRYLFADVANFRFFDFYLLPHEINDNVFAYVNGNEKNKVLVFYNNSIERTSGWIYRAAPFLCQGPEGAQRTVVDTIAESLGINNKASFFTLFRNQKASLWYIRSNRELHGMGFFAALEGYESQVFTDFYQVEDLQGHYALMAEHLNGGGVENPEELLKEIIYKPLHDKFYRLFKGPDGRDCPFPHRKGKEKPDKKAINGYLAPLKDFFETARDLSEGLCSTEDLIKEAERMILYTPTDETNIHPYQNDLLEGFIPLVNLSKIIGDDSPSISLSLTKEWGLDLCLRNLLRRRGFSEEEALKILDRLFLCLSYSGLWEEREIYGSSLKEQAEHIFQDYHTARFLRVNSYNGDLWFNKESFGELLNLIRFSGLIKSSGRKTGGSAGIFNIINSDIAVLKKAEKASGYRVDLFLNSLKPPGRKGKKKSPPGKLPGRAEE